VAAAASPARPGFTRHPHAKAEARRSLDGTNGNYDRAYRARLCRPPKTLFGPIRVGVGEKSDVEYESVIFKVYSDGSGMTGGPAGIGFVAYVDYELLLSGNLPVASATNHQAELRAAAFALNSIPEGQDVELLSDSEYVVKNFNEYLPRWRAHGWRNSGGGAVANHALWEELIGAVKRHRSVRFEWTKGHDGTEGNEHAHRLASQARRVAEGVDTLSRDRWEEH
jgi:ribonuclease HI